MNFIGRHGDGRSGFVGSHVSHDVPFSWVTPLKWLKLLVGAVNVTEKMPPLVNGDYSFTPYDAYRRQAYARVEMRF